MSIGLSVQIKQVYGKLLLPTEATLKIVEMHKYMVPHCLFGVMRHADNVC